MVTMFIFGVTKLFVQGAQIMEVQLSPFNPATGKKNLSSRSIIEDEEPWSQTDVTFPVESHHICFSANESRIISFYRQWLGNMAWR